MRKFLLPFFVVLACGLPVHACLWDRDTLQQERSAFPNMLELITGKFLRHSDVYYKWRVLDRVAKLKSSPENLALMDDLAVAYDKLKQSDKAIEVAQQALELAPDRYETLANLGTFYIHAGKFEKGAKLIEKAITINPDAHFGREKYQLILVQYLISKMEDGKLPDLPLSDKNSHFPGAAGEFIKYVAEEIGEDAWNDDGAQKLLTGIQGMMRFGHYDSPILLEAAGESLVSMGHMRLASRAFLQASYVVTTEKAKAAYRAKAKNALELQVKTELEDVEKKFLEELTEAQTWFGRLKTNEEKWCAPDSGFDPDEKFDQLFNSMSVSSSQKNEKNELAAIVFATFAVSVAGFALWQNARRKA